MCQFALASGAGAALRLLLPTITLEVWGTPTVVLVDTAWRLAGVACGGWAAVTSASGALERVAAAQPRQAETIRAAATLAARAMAACAVLIALSVLRVPLQAILTFGGAGGIIVGLGARDLASNAFAGANLLMSRTLREGDFVQIMGGVGVIGIVIDISLTHTVILCEDATEVIIPNSQAREAAGMDAARLDLHLLTRRIADCA